MTDVINIPTEDVEVIDYEDYKDNISDHFNDIPDMADSILKSAKQAFSKIEEMLYSAPAFINAIKAAVPEETLQAVMTDEQKTKVAKGALKLMTKKDGTLMANLVDPETNKIVTNIPLKSVRLAPEITQAMTSYAGQMQMAQIAEDIRLVQHAVEEVRQGQEYDRLATAYSCQQKLLQAMEIKNPELRMNMLLRIASDAEDSRNLLMQSQSNNIMFIKEQPDSFFGKLISGATSEKVDQRMTELRESLNAVNMVSLAEAIAYQEMGEEEAARKSLEYYAQFIEQSYLNKSGLVRRLDLIDPAPENYWTNTLPNIKEKIYSLPKNYDNPQLETGGESDE